jgi:hypothetical protein
MLWTAQWKNTCRWDHSYLAKGERGRILLLSQTRDQAGVAKGYILATLESNRVEKATVSSHSSRSAPVRPSRSAIKPS